MAAPRRRNLKRFPSNRKLNAKLQFQNTKPLPHMAIVAIKVSSDSQRYLELLIMEQTQLQIGGTLSLAVVTYEGNFPPDLFFEFTERSPDPWYSDSVTTVDITKEKAAEIVDILIKQFDLHPVIPTDVTSIES